MSKSSSACESVVVGTNYTHGRPMSSVMHPMCEALMVGYVWSPVIATQG